MRELFVYYRVLSEQAEAAGLAVRTMQARMVKQHPSLRPRLLCRDAPAGPAQTWMETYATDPVGAPAGVTDGMQLDIESAAHELPPHLIQGERKSEFFRT